MRAMVAEMRRDIAALRAELGPDAAPHHVAPWPTAASASRSIPPCPACDHAFRKFDLYLPRRPAAALRTPGRLLRAGGTGLARLGAPPYMTRIAAAALAREALRLSRRARQLKDAAAHGFRRARGRFRS